MNIEREINQCTDIKIAKANLYVALLGKSLDADTGTLTDSERSLINSLEADADIQDILEVIL